MTWLIHTCDVTHSYATWLIHMWRDSILRDKTHPAKVRESMSMWLEETNSYVSRGDSLSQRWVSRRDSFICEWRDSLSPRTTSGKETPWAHEQRSYVKREWLIHTCMTYFYVPRESFICEMFFSSMRRVEPTNICESWVINSYAKLIQPKNVSPCLCRPRVD